MDLVAQLIAEHQDYVIKLESLAETIEGIRVNGRGDLFVEILDGLFRPLTVELDDHARREEEFLFPKIVERVDSSPVPVMIEEHEKIRAESAEFSRWYQLWREGDDDLYHQWADPALELRGTFSAHMQKENLILFPMARRILTADELLHWGTLGDR